MMNQKEQTAFVDAYVFNVADTPREYVADFVARYANGGKMKYSHDDTNIMDALGMWHAAIMFAMIREKL